MSTNVPAPDTIILIHGLWVTPRSWEHWIVRYESRGYRVLAPAYPGFDVEVEALNADPSPIEAVTLPAILDRLTGIINGLDKLPILMGHSAGGALTQILLDRGLGAVGVAINSAPTEGVLVAPLSQLRSTLSVFAHLPTTHTAIKFSQEQWQYAFTNTFSDEEVASTYQRYAIPGPGHIVWHGVLANVRPGPQDAFVNYANDARPPLLFLSGGADNLMPPSVQRSNFAHYTSKTITELKEYEGRAHLMPAERGWEEVADYALEWAVEHATGIPAARTASAAGTL